MERDPMMSANIRYEEYRGKSYPITEVSDLFDLISLSPTSESERMWDKKPEFFGGEHWNYLAKAAVEGTNSRFLPLVERLLNQVNVQLDVETKGYNVDNAVVGFLPDIPAAIQNLPESMISVEPTQKDFAPINVYVAGSISGGLNMDQVALRGAATVAMISKLQTIRPVNLYYLKGNGDENGRFGLLPIPTRPMNLSQISFMLCHAGFMRWTIYTLTGYNQKLVPFDPIFIAHNRDAYAPTLARDTITFIGGDPEHDIYVPPLFIHDPILNNPVKWIEETLAQYRKA